LRGGDGAKRLREKFGNYKKRIEASETKMFEDEELKENM
jgi:hypothetical protein